MLEKIQFINFPLKEISSRIMDQSNPIYGVLATSNLDHIRVISEDSNIRKTYLSCDYFTIDGWPIELALKSIWGKQTFRAPGSDITAEVLTRAMNESVEIGIIGTGRLDEDSFLEKLKNKYPGLLVRAVNPPVSNSIEDLLNLEVEALVSNEKIRILLVCLGFPKQEAVAVELSKRYSGKIFLCVGGSVDFLVETQRRAPNFFRAFRLEWFWRMCSGGSRLRSRYMKCIWFLPKFITSEIAAKFGKKPNKEM